MKFRYPCFLLFFAFFLNANAFSADFEDNTYLGDVESFRSKISQTKDNRKDGVSYERDKVLALQRMKQTSAEESLGELLKPGHHVITLNFESASFVQETNSLLQYLIDSDISPQSSWDIIVDASRHCKGNITLLSEAIRVLPLINTLNWRASSPIPPVVLRSLEASHPTYRLYYELDFWGGQQNHQNWFPDSIPINENTTFEQRETLDSKNDAAARRHILNSTNLYSLKAPIMYGYRSTSSSMDLVFDILTSCPNIRELDLSIIEGGCESSDQATYSFNFQRINMTLRPIPLPPLEVLKLDGYIFETRPDGEQWGVYYGMEATTVYKWPWNKLPMSIINWVGSDRIYSMGGAWTSWAKVSDKNLEENNLDTWLQAMDWSNLHTLSLNSPTPETLRKLSGDTLPSLKDATFEKGYQDPATAIFEFLSNTSSPLKSITVESIEGLEATPSHILDVIATHHCPTLRNLKLTHELSKEPQIGLGTYYNAEEWQHPNCSFFNSTLLSQLRDSCPHLQNLEIDIESRDEWDYELLDTLASFEELKDLTLKFEPERAGQVYKHYGYDTLEQRRNYDALVGPVIAGLKGYLRERKMGVPFEKVEVWIGWDKF